MQKLLMVPVAIGAIACGNNAKSPEPPNILWITYEDLSSFPDVMAMSLQEPRISTSIQNPLT